MDINPEKISTQEFLQTAHKIPLADLLQQLDCDDNGLSGDEAVRREQQLGPNTLVGKKQTPELVKFLRQFKNYFAILLIIGGSLALLAERLDPGQGNLYIAWALFGVVVLNAVFTYIQEHQTERIMESFSRMLPQMVTVMRDGRPARIGAEHVVPGDVMMLYEGDRICADGRLLERNCATSMPPMPISWKAGTSCFPEPWCRAVTARRWSTVPGCIPRSAASYS